MSSRGKVNFHLGRREETKIHVGNFCTMSWETNNRSPIINIFVPIVQLSRVVPAPWAGCEERLALCKSKSRRLTFLIENAQLGFLGHTVKKFHWRAINWESSTVVLQAWRHLIPLVIIRYSSHSHSNLSPKIPSMPRSGKFINFVFKYSDKNPYLSSSPKASHPP